MRWSASVNSGWNETERNCGTCSRRVSMLGRMRSARKTRGARMSKSGPKVKQPLERFWPKVAKGDMSIREALDEHERPFCPACDLDVNACTCELKTPDPVLGGPGGGPASTGPEF